MPLCAHLGLPFAYICPIRAQIVALLRIVAQGGATPLGESILVSVYAWILAFMYAPPLHYSAVAATHPAAEAPERQPLEMAAQAALSLLLLPADVATLISGAVLAELRPIASAMLGASDPKSHLFSVSCASWLYDFAAAVYFDLPGFTTPSSYGPIPAMPHGFEAVAVLVDNDSDTVVSALTVCSSGTNSTIPDPPVPVGVGRTSGPPHRRLLPRHE